MNSYTDIGPGRTSDLPWTSAPEEMVSNAVHTVVPDETSFLEQQDVSINLKSSNDIPKLSTKLNRMNLNPRVVRQISVPKIPIYGNKKLQDMFSSFLEATKKSSTATADSEGGLSDEL